MGFDDSIIDKLSTELETHKDKQAKLRQMNKIFMFVLAGLTLSMVVMGIGLLLEYRALEHDYTLLSCDISCSRTYNDLNMFSDGYFPNPEGSITCNCYDIREPPQRKTPPILLN